MNNKHKIFKKVKHLNYTICSVSLLYIYFINIITSIILLYMLQYTPEYRFRKNRFCIEYLMTILV